MFVQSLKIGLRIARIKIKKINHPLKGSSLEAVCLFGLLNGVHTKRRKSSIVLNVYYLKCNKSYAIYVQVPFCIKILTSTTILKTSMIPL